MKRSFLEVAKPRKKPKIEIEHELADEDSNSSITTPDLLSDEESRYASALIGEVEPGGKPLSDRESGKPVIELETALASISEALAEDSQSVELDVSSIEKSVTELASILAPMAEKTQTNVVRNQGAINISDIERSVSEITNALAPMAKENQASQVKLDVPEIEQSVTELVAALVPVAHTNLTGKEVKTSNSSAELAVPEIERSMTELTAVLSPIPEDTSTNGKIVAQKTPGEINVPDIQKSELTTALTSLDPEEVKVAQPSKEIVNLDSQDAGLPDLSQEMPNQSLENQQKDQVERATKLETKIPQDELLSQQTIPPSLPKNIVCLDGKPVSSVDEHPQSIELVVEVPQLPLGDLSTAPLTHQNAKLHRLSGGKIDSHQVITNSPPPAIAGILDSKSDTEEGDDFVDVIPDNQPQQNMRQEKPAEKTEVQATSCTSLVSNESYTNKGGERDDFSRNAPPLENIPSERPAKKADDPVTSYSSILSDKSDTKKSESVTDGRHKIPPQQKLPQVEPAEKSDVSLTSSTSKVNSQAASTNIKSKDVVLRAVKEDLVRAYKEILKVEGGGISDERLGSLLLWLGIPQVSVNRHVRRIIRRKRKSGKPSRQTSLKNILRYFNYVLA